MFGVVAFFVNARFRLPVMPVMIVFAGYAACVLFSAFREKGPRALKIFAIFVVAFVLVNADYLAFAQIRGYSNAFSHTTLGNSYMTLGRRDLALDHYERAWKLNEAAPTQAFQYIARDVTYNMGLIYWEKGLCSRAIDALRRVGPAFDGSTDIYMINALDWLGDCYLRQSKFQRAFAAYQEFLRLKPDDVRATAGLARVYAGTGKLEEAERMLEGVVDASTQVYVPAYIALAEVQYKLGKSREAIESYKAISRFTGYEKDAFLALAELYQSIGDIDAAIQSLRQAAYYLPPGDPTVDNWIARLQSMR
jgi:tetratricopeptide (TPR) repeat protein